MHLFKKVIITAALGCGLGLLGGCASSRLVDVWHDPAFTAPPLKKMLVVAVRKDAAKRRIWEDAFTNELIEHGVTATPSYTLFPNALPDTNQVIETAQVNGFDGILAILGLTTETQTHYVPGYTTVEQKVRNTLYWQRYWTYYQTIEYPGYIDTQTVDLRTIDVSTTGSQGHLIWSATSRTPDPGTASYVRRGIVAMVTTELVERSIIQPKK